MAEQPWVRIVGSIILGGAGVLGAVVPLSWSQQERFERLSTNAVVNLLEIDSLKQKVESRDRHIAQLESVALEKLVYTDGQVKILPAANDQLPAANDQLPPGNDQLRAANDQVSPAVEVTVYCVGEVAQPGAMSFKSTEPITLRAAITRGGGLTARAANRVCIKRADAAAGTPQVEADYKRILAGQDGDVELRQGDTVVIRERHWYNRGRCH